MAVAYIGLGANLDAPDKQITLASKHLAAHPDIHLGRVSSFYRSPPLGPANQPDYCNAVAQVETRVAPQALLEILLRIEESMGRERGERWGPRLIDLDVLLYDDMRIDAPGLTVPHPEMHRRVFVMLPLLEIAPSSVIPGLGPVAELARQLDASELRLWEPSHG